MKPIDLKVGHLYRLTEDVKNPVTDGRSANKLLKRQIFSKGTHFVCLNHDEYKNIIQLAYGEYRGDKFVVGVRREGEMTEPRSARDQAWTKAIVPHLEEVEIDSWRRIRLAFGWSSTGSALEELWKDGTISTERLLELMRKHTIGASTE